MPHPHAISGHLSALSTLVNSFLLNLLSAFRSLREQRQRAVLSALGITVGSMAIVLLISIATGVRADISEQIEDLGVNLLVVLPFRMTEGTMFAPNAAGLSYLRREDVERVERVEGVRRAAPLTFAGGGIRRGEKASPTTFIIAAGAEWFNVRPVKLAEGEVYGQGDGLERVAVIGSIAKEQLFGEEPAVGKPVTINGEDYTVIGVTEDKKSEGSLFSMGGFENVAYIPYDLFSANQDNPQLHRIMIQTDPEVEPKKLVSSVEGALAQRLEPEMFGVMTQEDLLKLVYRLMGILTWLLTGLTSIALFVGGVGIMTVMLMSVGERAKEIGIRKTVGAKQRDIFVQFLAEAVSLALLGGAVGLAISYGVCLLLFEFTPVKPMVTREVVALSFIVSLGVGALFGLLPAMRAARQDPVVSLRNE